MSATCVFTPVVVEMAWPALSALLVSSLGTIGYQAVAEGVRGKNEAERSVDIEVPSSSEFAETLGEEEETSFEREGLRLSFKKALDGRLKACASGSGTDDELRRAGREAVDAFLQAYVRERVSAELKKRGYALEEERLEDGSIRLKARRWG